MELQKKNLLVTNNSECDDTFKTDLTVTKFQEFRDSSYKRNVIFFFSFCGASDRFRAMAFPITSLQHSVLLVTLGNNDPG
jgi:hypothetical protein